MGMIKSIKIFSAVSHKNSHSSLAISWKIVFLLPTVNNEGRFCSWLKGTEAVLGVIRKGKVLSIHGVCRLEARSITAPLLFKTLESPQDIEPLPSNSLLCGQTLLLAHIC